MPASHKLKLTLLDAKFQKLTASKLTDGCLATSQSTSKLATDACEAILITNLIETLLVIHWCGSIPPYLVLRPASGKKQKSALVNIV